MKDYEGVIMMVLNDTLKNKLTWQVFKDTPVYRAYVARIELTPKKKLEIVLNSFTTGNHLSNVSFYFINDKERLKLKDVGFHFAARPIFDLLNILSEKYKRGEFNK